MNYHWESMDTAPEIGTFLVYIPELRSGNRIHVCKIVKNAIGQKIVTIGNLFRWDMPAPTKWCHIPMLSDDMEE